MTSMMDLQIKTRSLGGLEVSEVGLGCKPFSGCYSSTPEVDDMKEVVDFVVSHNCTFFDVSPTYGNAEAMLGTVIAPYRERVVLSTKFGLVDGRPDSSEAAIRASLEGSLARLQTDYIDIYFQECPDPATPIEDVAATMQALLDEGKIRHWGIVDADEQTIRAAHAVCSLTAIMNRYSILYRKTEELFDVLEELGIGLFAHSPLAQGFLTCSSEEDYEYADDDIRSTMPLFSEGGFEANEGVLDLVEGLAAWKYATNAHVALRWLLLQRPYIVPVAGASNFKEADANICSVMLELSPTDLMRMKPYLKDFAFANGYEPTL